MTPTPNWNSAWLNRQVYAFKTQGEGCTSQSIRSDDVLLTLRLSTHTYRRFRSLAFPCETTASDPSVSRTTATTRDNEVLPLALTAASTSSRVMRSRKRTSAADLRIAAHWNQHRPTGAILRSAMRYAIRSSERLDRACHKRNEPRGLG